ncbi:uncharacterized protein LOC101855714 [Aplysia californica]|uniref:Uncharacterized protein LOC101855714 n=1 Tax=Aplysia californica TaxID=6500 RepID=A0ABM0JJH1_APLCA|nr:uncharacterized protein LOC101855714 [Aplysia californica]
MNGIVDFNNCFVVGMQADSSDSHKYKGVARTFDLANLTTQDCCNVLLDSVKTEVAEKGEYPDSTLVPAAKPVCTGAADTTCSGDLGSPVYCKTTDSPSYDVLVAVVASSPCNSDTPLLLQDLTNGAIDNFF